MRVCLECENVFKEDMPFDDCPTLECWGDIIEIDENLFEASRLLNRKGYSISKAYSAHSFSPCPNTLIQFYGNIKFSKLPTGFTAETLYLPKRTITNLCKEYSCTLSSVKLQCQIWEAAKELLYWAEDLPKRDCFE